MTISRVPRVLTELSGAYFSTCNTLVDLGGLGAGDNLPIFRRSERDSGLPADALTMVSTAPVAFFVNPAAVPKNVRERLNAWAVEEGLATRECAPTQPDLRRNTIAALDPLLMLFPETQGITDPVTGERAEELVFRLWLRLSTPADGQFHGWMKENRGAGMGEPAFVGEILGQRLHEWSSLPRVEPSPGRDHVSAREADPYGWALQQSELLEKARDRMSRSGLTAEIDLEGLGEVVDAIAERCYRAGESAFGRMLSLALRVPEEVGNLAFQEEFAASCEDFRASCSVSLAQDLDAALALRRLGHGRGPEVDHIGGLRTSSLLAMAADPQSVAAAVVPSRRSMPRR